MKLTKEECQLLLKKLEYNFKKKAKAEVETLTESQLSANAKLYKKILDAAESE